MKSTFVSSLFSNLEHMNQDSFTDFCKFSDCYKLKTLIYPFVSRRKLKKYYMSRCQKRFQKESMEID